MGVDLLCWSHNKILLSKFPPLHAGMGTPFSQGLERDPIVGTKRDTIAPGPSYNVGVHSGEGSRDGAERASPGSDGGAGGPLEVGAWCPRGGGAAMVYGKGGMINAGGDDAVVGVGTELRPMDARV
ncbi:hypothetical protein U1Q18_036334 [Sarracenia purpurea var. burkii]